MSDQTNPDDKPVTTKDRIITVLWAVGFIALGVAMIIWPEAVSGDGDRPRKLIGKIIVWIWGRPGGIGLALIGLFIGWSAFPKSDSKKAE